MSSRRFLFVLRWLFGVLIATACEQAELDLFTRSVIEKVDAGCVPEDSPCLAKAVIPGDASSGIRTPL